MVCKLGRGDDCVDGMPHLVDDDLLGEFAQVEEQGDGSIMFELTRAAAFLYRRYLRHFPHIRVLTRTEHGVQYTVEWNTDVLYTVFRNPGWIVFRASALLRVYFYDDKRNCCTLLIASLSPYPH